MIKLNHKKSTALESALQKSVISTGFEKLDSVPLNHANEKHLRNQRRVRNNVIRISFYFLKVFVD